MRVAGELANEFSLLSPPFELFGHNAQNCWRSAATVSSKVNVDCFLSPLLSFCDYDKMVSDALLLLAMLAALQLLLAGSSRAEDAVEVTDGVEGDDAKPNSGLNLLSAEEEARLAGSGEKHT